MKRKLYKSVSDFVEDIKWFVHNCCTISIKGEEKEKKATNDLIGYVEEQIQLIQACGECYENAYECGKSSVLMLCSKPHLLLLAKFKSHYWPAKLMTVDVENKTAHVRFFDDYAKSILPVRNCYFYSENCPEGKYIIRKRSSKMYSKAKEV